MNQVSRQNSQTDVEKDFYKLMNNTNFGYDCHNNAHSCYFHPVYDEIEELSYAKRYQAFDQDISDRTHSMNFTKLEKIRWKLKKMELDAVFSMKKSRQKKHKKIQ